MTICSLTDKYSNIRSNKNSIHNFRDLVPVDLIISFDVSFAQLMTILIILKYSSKLKMHIIIKEIKSFFAKQHS